MSGRILSFLVLVPLLGGCIHLVAEPPYRGPPPRVTEIAGAVEDHISVKEFHADRVYADVIYAKEVHLGR